MLIKMTGTRKFIFLTLAICICFAGIALAADGGSQENPLVTLSYLQEVFKPDIVKIIEEKIAASGGSQNNPTGTGYVGFQAIELKAGLTLLGHEGTEVILRAGKAVAVAQGANGLTDITAGIDLPGGDSIVANHAYIIPRRDGRGLKMTTDGFVMVKGPYDLG